MKKDENQRTLTLVFCILLGILYSCNHHDKIVSKQYLWNDINSFVKNGEDYRLFYLDSSWYKKTIKVEMDSNLLLKNILVLDERLSKDLESITQLNEQGGTLEYHFYIMDSLVIGAEDRYLLLLEQYKADPPMLYYNSLILALIKEDRILSKFNLAVDLSSTPCEDFRSSILISGKTIISKSVSHCTSDNQDENGKSLGIGQTESEIITEYYSYNQKTSMFDRKARNISRVKNE